MNNFDCKVESEDFNDAKLVTYHFVDFNAIQDHVMVVFISLMNV